MKYIIIITLFLASCSKNTCYECFDKGIETQVCQGDSIYNQVEEKERIMKIVGTTSEYFIVNKNYKCLFKD